MNSETRDKLDTAIRLSVFLRNINGSPALHALSKGAWRRHCLQLGGFVTQAELQACRGTIQERCPALAREVEIRAKLWANGHQDRPATFHFLDPDRFVAAYAEALAARISEAQSSAVAAWRCADLRPASSFGRLDDFADLEAQIVPIRRQLEQLDGELAKIIRLDDCEWTATGPELHHQELVVPIDATTVRRLATAIAELIQRHPAPSPHPVPAAA